MDVAQIVSLVVNILFALAIALGFFWGLGRGLKKSGLRLVVFLVFLVLGALLSPVITKGVLKIEFTFQGTKTSLLGFLENFVQSQPEVAEVIAANPSVETLVTQIVTVVANLVVFLLCFYLFRLVGWIVFGIIKPFVFSKERRIKKQRKQLEESKRLITDLAPDPIKKRKMLGGLVGLAQGIIIAFVLFLPFNGLIGTVNDLRSSSDSAGSGSGAGSAVISTMSGAVGGGEGSIGDPDPSTGSTSFDFTTMPDSFSTLIDSYLPDIAKDVLDVYEKSAPAKVFGVGKFDLLCFDTISTMKVNGEKIVLRKELENVSSVYSNAVYLAKFDWQSLDFENFDYAKAKSAINSVFDFGLVKSVLPELMPYGLNRFIVDDASFSTGTGYDAEIKQAVKDVLKEYGSSNDAFVQNVKSDILALFGVFEEISKTGVFKEFKVESENDIDVEKVLSLLCEKASDGSTALSRSVGSLLSSKTLQISITTGLNIGLNELEKIAAVDANQFGRLTYSSSVWSHAIDEAKNLVNNVAGIYNKYDALTDAQKTTLKTFSMNDAFWDVVSTLNLSDYVTPIGKVLDIVKNSSVLKISSTSSVADKVIDWANTSDKTSQITQFVDFNAAKSGIFSFESTLSKLIEIANRALKEDEDGNSIVKYATAAVIDIDGIVDSLNSDITDGDASTKTIGELLAPIIGLDLIRPAVIFGTDLLNDKVEQFINEGKAEEDKIVIADVNEEEIDINSQLTEISTIIDKLVPIVKDVMTYGFDLEKLNTERFGEAFDLLKQNSFKNVGGIVSEDESSLFAKTYLGLIEYVKSLDETLTAEKGLPGEPGYQPRVTYGDKITSILEGYETPLDVNWTSIFKAAQAAIDLSKNGAITPDAISSVVEVIKDNPELEEIVKDAITEQINSDATLSQEDKEALDTVVQNLDLTDESTSQTVEAVATAAGTILKEEATNEEIVSAAEQLITDLGEIEDQTKVDDMINVIDQVVGEGVQLPEGTSANDKTTIEDTIASSSLSDESKQKLRELLGL